jgi:HEAT repeats
MTLRHIVTAGIYLAFVPLIGATGTWTAPPTGAAFSEVEAPETMRIAGPVAGQLPMSSATPVRGSHVEHRSSASLPATVRSIADAASTPVWIAWVVPSVQSRESHDDGGRWLGPCVLQDDGSLGNGNHGTSTGTRELVVLVRLTRTDVGPAVFTDARCIVEAGERPVYFLDGVRPAESVAYLSGLVERDGAFRKGDRRHGFQTPLAAIALTDDPTVDPKLEAFVQPDKPSKLRRDAAFWLGAARGATGAALVDRLARHDADDGFREHLTFVLTLTGDRGLDTLIDLARHDQSSQVRRQALFWLGQKAGQRAIGTLNEAVNADPESDVRKQAVFAISQRPKDESVPRLIELARTHRDPEVRKQAMFWLGQSGDPRALEFFEKLLKN